jgi:hypothetical protein
MSPEALCVQESQVGKKSGMQPHDGVLPHAAGRASQLTEPVDVDLQYCRPCWHRSGTADALFLGHRNVGPPSAPPPPSPVSAVGDDPQATTVRTTSDRTQPPQRIDFTSTRNSRVRAGHDLAGFQGQREPHPDRNVAARP